MTMSDVVLKRKAAEAMQRIVKSSRPDIEGIGLLCEALDDLLGAWTGKRVRVQICANGQATSDVDDMEQDSEHERALWVGWVQTVCRWKKIAPPSEREWGALTKSWCIGKAATESVAELVALRNTPNYEALRQAPQGD